MFKLISKVKSPYDIEDQVLPAFGTITVPAISDYTRLLRDLDIVAIEENKDTIDIERPKRGRKPNGKVQESDSDADTSVDE